jgi:hypothetical protein
MTWSPLLIAAACALVIAVAIIAVVERWDQLAPVLTRWAWIPEGALAVLLGQSALDSLLDGRPGFDFLAAGLSVMFLWSAGLHFHRLRKRRSSSSN